MAWPDFSAWGSHVPTPTTARKGSPGIPSKKCPRGAQPLWIQILEHQPLYPMSCPELLLKILFLFLFIANHSFSHPSYSSSWVPSVQLTAYFVPSFRCAGIPPSCYFQLSFSSMIVFSHISGYLSANTPWPSKLSLGTSLHKQLPLPSGMKCDQLNFSDRWWTWPDPCNQPNCASLVYSPTLGTLLYLCPHSLPHTNSPSACKNISNIPAVWCIYPNMGYFI